MMKSVSQLYPNLMTKPVRFDMVTVNSDRFFMLSSITQVVRTDTGLPMRYERVSTRKARVVFPFLGTPFNVPPATTVELILKEEKR